MSGPYASIGATVSASLAAAMGHIKSDLGGVYQGYRPTIVMADAPLTAGDGQAAYAQLTARHVDAILWCGAQGLAESLDTIVADLRPIIAVGTDLQSRVPANGQVPDLTTTSGAGFPVFQTSVPDVGAIDLLLEYAANDRGFSRAGLIFSSSSSPGCDTVFAAFCQKWGLSDAVTIGYDNTAGTPDLSDAVRAMRHAEAEAVVVVGAAEDAVAVAGLLDEIGSRYVDTPTTKADRFVPMLLGSPSATSTAVFAAGAGLHAARGTIGASSIGAVVGLPDAPMRRWIAQFVPTYNGGFPRGGEDGPADALAALLAAAAVAESTQGADLVAALESGFNIQFATSAVSQFGPGQHLSVTNGDLCLQTLESSPETEYDLGQDWGPIFPTGYRGSDLLVDFTQARNSAAQPAVMTQLLSLRYGISSQAAYQQDDPAKMQACAAIH